MAYAKTPPFSSPFTRDAVSQLDATRFAESNCTLESLRVLIYMASLGFYDPLASFLRTLSGDTSGGVSFDDAIAAGLKATGGEVKIERVYWAPETLTDSTIRKLLNTTRGIGLSTLFSAVAGTSFYYGFGGGHTIVVVGPVFKDSEGVERAWVMDPGRSTYYVRWEAWPLKLIIKAAKARTGSDTIHAMFTRDLTNVSRVTKVPFRIFSSPSMTATVVARGPAGLTRTVLKTLRGGNWTVPGSTRTSKGWSQVGANQFMNGMAIR